MTPYQIKQGDRLPSLTASVGFDLTGATVAFVLTPKARGGSAKVNAAAVVVSASAGTVQYNWGATDTDTVGEYLGEFVATFAGGKRSYPQAGYLDIEVIPHLPRPSLP